MPKKETKTKKKSSKKKKSQEEKKQQKKEDEQKGQRIRIKIKAYDHKLIDESASQICKTAKRLGAKIAGPVPLPTEKHSWTVNRSTFVHKDARDQYEMRIHKRLIDIYDPSPKLIDSLQDLDLPSGVEIQVKY